MKTWQILEFISKINDWLYSTEIAESMEMSQKDASAFLNHCGKMGWLKRARDPQKIMRGYFYCITDRGRDKLERVYNYY